MTTLFRMLSCPGALRRASLRATIAVLGLLVVSTALPAPAQAVLPSTPTSTSETLTRSRSVLASLRARSNAKDPRYVSDGTFVDGSPQCFRCTMGPAVASATFGVKANDPAVVASAVLAFDRAIKNHQRPDGAFGPAGPGEGGFSIQTVLFANELGSAYLTLGGRLDCAHRTAWRNVLTSAADYLIRAKELTWYTNGNINLAKTINMDLTYRITGQARFKTAADASYAFTLSPPQAQWKGFGLRFTRAAKAANGSDGAAYLAEAGAGGVGFDTDYTMLQANMAATWFALTRDPRALRLTNLLYNQLTPRVRTSDWTIDVGGGTRLTRSGVRYGFLVSALPVLALQGGRADLTTAKNTQLPLTLKEYERVTGLVNPGSSYGYGVEFATTLAAVLPTPGNTLRVFSCG